MELHQINKPKKSKQRGGTSTNRTASTNFTEDPTDDDTWLAEVNIDSLIGDPIVFDFPSQLNQLRLVQWDVPPALGHTPAVTWNFPSLVKNSHSSSAWRFQKQSIQDSGAPIGHWSFAKQLDENGASSEEKWVFKKVCCAEDFKDNWKFKKQSTVEATINWNFLSHSDNPSKILWRFQNQSCSTRTHPNDWYFKTQTKEKRAETESTEFQQQIATISQIDWPFSSMTPEIEPGKWKFARQTQEVSRIPWRFKHMLDAETGHEVVWSFLKQTKSNSAIKWTFSQTLPKDVDSSKIKWKFKQSLESTRPQKWDFPSQTQNIEPVRWNMPNMTEGLGKAKSYEEILKENQTFKDHYSLAFVKKNVQPSTLDPGRRKTRKK